MKKVKQISLDILVGPETDGEALAQTIANELVRRGFAVLGTGFQCDLTEVYESLYPNLLNQE
jgi:hypothetical protein